MSVSLDLTAAAMEDSALHETAAATAATPVLANVEAPANEEEKEQDEDAPVVAAAAAGSPKNTTAITAAAAAVVAENGNDAAEAGFEAATGIPVDSIDVDDATDPTTANDDVASAAPEAAADGIPAETATTEEAPINDDVGGGGGADDETQPVEAETETAAADVNVDSNGSNGGDADATTTAAPAEETETAAEASANTVEEAKGNDKDPVSEAEGEGVAVATEGEAVAPLGADAAAALTVLVQRETDMRVPSVDLSPGSPSGLHPVNVQEVAQPPSPDTAVEAIEAVVAAAAKEDEEAPPPPAAPVAAASIEVSPPETAAESDHTPAAATATEKKEEGTAAAEGPSGAAAAVSTTTPRPPSEKNRAILVLDDDITGRHATPYLHQQQHHGGGSSGRYATADNSNSGNTATVASFDRTFPPGDSSPTEAELLIAQALAEENGTHVLAAFRRGADNSHVNRMRSGSYSRYLQSTRTLLAGSPQRLTDSFHGSAPTVGTVPRNVALVHHQYNETHGGQQQQQQRHGGSGGASAFATDMGGSGPFNSTSGGGSGRRHSSRSAGSRSRSRGRQGRFSPSSSGRGVSNSQFARTATNGVRGGDTNGNSARAGGGGVFHPGSRATATGGTMLRREVQLLSDGPYNELVAQRDRRRRDVQRCRQLPQEKADYVYYNHKSKGYYVPQEKPPDALLLTYNHSFDYGPDGTRMSKNSGGGGGGNCSRFNPTAEPPRSLAESRGAPWRHHAQSQQQQQQQQRGKGAMETMTTTRRATTGQQQRSAAAAAASSLRTAHAVEPASLKGSQFRAPRTIEEVVAAGNPAAARAATASVTAALRRGVLTERDLPPGDFSAAAAGSARGATAKAAADMDRRGLEEGQLPPVRPGGGGGGSAVPTAKAYGVSRLNYTPRQDPGLTPSAYV